MLGPIRLRYDATCAACATALPAGTRAIWDRAARAATCLACVEMGTATSPTADADHAAADSAMHDVTRTVRLRRPATCSSCGAPLSVGDDAAWNASSKTAAHLACTDDAPTTGPALDLGVAGGSARKIADRQRARREQVKEARDEATREAHPRFGNLIVKARDFLAEPEKPTSWQKGAAGEEAAGRTLDRLVDHGFVVLHDRCRPGTKWNIDHLVVGSRGVYVIDAKHYSGRLEIRSTGTLFRPGPKRVFVNARSQDKRVAALDWQVESVRQAAGELIERYGGVIKPVLCFIGVEVALTQRPDVVGANHVLVTWPRRFVKDVGRDGPLSRSQITEVAQAIARALPPAVTTRSSRS